jgi:NAD(P)H-dependent FMN reductase
MKIIGISGSLRKASYNTALLKAAAEISSAIEIGSIADFPLYNADLEKQHGVPQAVLVLQEKFEQADGILIVSPEYNQGIPGVLKNAIDWLSRPDDRIATVFAGKPLAMMGATPGGFGTLNAQNAWLLVWRALRVRLWNEKMPFMVPRAHTVFDENGQLSDDKTLEKLKAHIEGFVDFVRMK